MSQTTRVKQPSAGMIGTHLASSNSAMPEERSTGASSRSAHIVNYAGTGDRPGGIYDGITSEGLMAVYQKCAHLGCRVPFCQQSQWFECPCHGTKYNYAGEYELGPAPTGLHRFPVRVEDGALKVDTGIIVTGPPRGTDTIRQAPEGPFCVG